MLKGNNELIITGPFRFNLLGGNGEVEADKIVLASKNKGVGKIKISALETVKDKVLNLLTEVVSSNRTSYGVKSYLESGDAMLWEDVFWRKPKTNIKCIPPKKKEPEKRSLSSLREEAENT